MLQIVLDIVQDGADNLKPFVILQCSRIADADYNDWFKGSIKGTIIRDDERTGNKNVFSIAIRKTSRYANYNEFSHVSLTPTISMHLSASNRDLVIRSKNGSTIITLIPLYVV